jgi:hypothetical protein
VSCRIGLYDQLVGTHNRRVSDIGFHPHSRPVACSFVTAAARGAAWGDLLPRRAIHPGLSHQMRQEPLGLAEPSAITADAAIKVTEL